MSENQNLRQALQAISHIDDTTNHSVDASAALDRIGQIARQALALPNAEQVDDINVAESFTSVTKTAAPVGEREAFENEMRHVDVWGHRSLKKRASGNYENWQVNLMWDVWQARAAMSAGDAVDAQRYRWLREQHWSNSDICCVNKPKQNVRLGGMCPSGDLLDAVIDAAMRKGQL